MHTKSSLTVNFIKSNGLWCAFLFLLACLGSMLHIFLPLSIGSFFELVFESNSSKADLLFMLGIKISHLSHFFLIFVLLTLLLGMQQFAFKYVSGVIGERFSKSVREATFEHQMSQSLSTHTLKADGKYLLRYSGDLNAIHRYLVKGIIQFSADLLFILLFSAFAFTFNPFLAALVCGMFALSYAITYILSKSTYIITRIRRTQRSKLLGFVSSRMHGFITIKAFNREKKEVYSFQRRSQALYLAGLNYFFKTSLVQSIIPILYFASLGIALYSIAFSESTRMHKAAAVSFILMYLYMQTIMKRAQRTSLIWQYGSVSFHKLAEILNFEREERKETFSTQRFEKSIEVKNLSFTFRNAAGPLFSNLNFKVEGNGIVWLKGKTSSGKSTLLKLILGVYQPTQGEICYDNQSTRNLTPFEIRRSVSLISDEVPMLGGSIRKSILFNDEPRNLSKALELMRALHFQPHLTDDELLNFKLEDNARNLSSSDRMKLQFVRAFATKKKMILIDSPFLALDESTLLVVTNFLNRIQRDYLVLLTSGIIPQDLQIKSQIVI